MNFNPPPGAPIPPGAQPQPGTQPPPAPLHWPLILGLGAVALIRPLSNITGLSEVIGQPWTALGATLLVSMVWLGVVGFGRVPRPFLTIVLASLAYGLYAIVLSAVLSPILTGELQGPVTMPWAIIPLMLSNAVWGAVIGALAVAVQAVRNRGHAH